MQIIRAFLFACFVVVLSGGCASIQPVPTGTKAIVLGTPETRPVGLSKGVLPAGEYLPDFQTEHGIYYLAPSSIITSGLGLSSASRGGLFVPFPSNKDQRQGIWLQLGSGGTAIGTLLNASSGGTSTYLYRFDVAVPFTSK